MRFGPAWLRALYLLAGPVLVIFLAVVRLGDTTGVAESAVRWDRMAKRQPWDIVVVGASFARTDVDGDVLASALGSRQEKPLVLIANGSSAPVWYAILKERVYGNGLAPKYVVLPATIWTLLTNRLPPAEMREVLEQMPVADEVVLRRSFDAGLPVAVQRLAQRRADLRDPILDLFRNLVPRLLLGMDAAAVEVAGTAVFGEHHGGAGARMIPTVEAGGEVGPVSDYLASDPADSYLADIADLVHDNDGRLVVVLPPLLRLPAGAPDVGTSLDRPLHRWARDSEVTVLDYRDLGWDSSRYTDALHLRPDAAKELTEAIVAAVQNGGDVTPEDAVRVSRKGTPPKLPAAAERPGKEPCQVNIAARAFAFLGTKATESRFPGLPSPITVWEGGTQLLTPLKKGACTGTVSHAQTIRASRLRANGPRLELRWSETVPEVLPSGWKVHWVYPGTSLNWELPAASGAPARVAARVGVLGEARGAPELAVGGRRAPFTISGGEGGAELTTDSAVREITIQSPKGGPFLVVTELLVESGGASTTVVARPPPRRLHVLDAGTVSGAGPAPPIAAMPVENRGDAWWFAVPWNSLTPCSPLRVMGPGGLLPARPTAKSPVAKGTWHLRSRLEFLPEAGRQPTDYRVAFDPDRACRRVCKTCGDRIWVYPGDALEVVVPAEPRLAVAQAFARLRLTTWIDAPVTAESVLRVLVRQGASVLAEREIRAEALNGSVELPFAEPLAAVGELTVELRSEGDLPATLVLPTLEDR